MLQNGIDLSTVDVSYVSSRSWYSCNSLATISFTNEQKHNFNITNEHQLLVCWIQIIIDVYND